jgi:hypothetical protein
MSAINLSRDINGSYIMAKAKLFQKTIKYAIQWPVKQLV